jgi:hypothetical protein
MMHCTANIEEEAGFHSIVVMRTRQVEVANRFEHTIFTKHDRISYSPEEDEQGFDYNMELDAVKLSWDGRKVVLANFLHVRNVLEPQELRNGEVMHCSKMGTLSSLEFFLYLSSQHFCRIKPLLTVKNTILFLLAKEEEARIRQ